MQTLLTHMPTQIQISLAVGMGLLKWCSAFNCLVIVPEIGFFCCFCFSCKKIIFNSNKNNNLDEPLCFQMCSVLCSHLHSWSSSPAACSCQTTASPPRAPSSVGTFPGRSAAGTTTRPPCLGLWWSACHKSAFSVQDTSPWSLCRSFPLWSLSPF